MLKLVFNDHGEVVPRKIEGSVRPDNPFTRLIAASHHSLIPDGVRAIVRCRHTSHLNYLFEESPRFRFMWYRNVTYYLPMPWTVYVVELQENRMTVGRVFFRSAPISSPEDGLYWATLPNVYLDPTMPGKICTSNDARVEVPIDSGRKRLDHAFAAALDAFWTSHFNPDITTYTAFQPFISLGGSEQNAPRGFEGWAALTPEQMLRLPYSEATTLIGQGIGATSHSLTVAVLLDKMAHSLEDNGSTEENRVSMLLNDWQRAAYYDTLPPTTEQANEVWQEEHEDEDEDEEYDGDDED